MYCLSCKPTEAIGLMNRRCACSENAVVSFALPGQSAQYCSKCPDMPPEAINVKCKRCECGKNQACYAPVGSKKHQWCRLCKPSDALYSRGHRCACDLQRTALFGFPEDGIAQFCTSCKPLTAVNIASTRCVSCSHQAAFGYLFSVRRHCGAHKLPGMYRMPNPKCNAADSCLDQPCFTDQDDNYPLRCELHQIEGDKDVINRQCSKCGISSYIREGAECDACTGFQVKKWTKKKEKAILALLTAHDIPFDTQVHINTRYPDVLIECDKWSIILEVDERQHRGSSYNCSCEQIRMLQMFNHPRFIEKKLMIIRYNPDGYEDENGKKHRMTVSRQQQLIKTIHHYRQTEPVHNLSVLYLFYDGSDDTGLSPVFGITQDSYNNCLIVESSSTPSTQ